MPLDDPFTNGNNKSVINRGGDGPPNNGSVNFRGTNAKDPFANE